MLPGLLGGLGSLPGPRQDLALVRTKPLAALHTDVESRYEDSDSFGLYSILLYCIIMLYYIILHYVMLYCTMLYCIIFYYCWTATDGAVFHLQA